MGHTLAHGQVFAGYRIERLLGVGGMGEVYLARDRDLPRWVALKLLSRAVTNDVDIRARFLREADTAARLSHPNIVIVYARGQEGDQLWMAMQYVDGTDVAAVLRNGPIGPEPTIQIITETAKALDHAHRSGVLHRDVKPANILLSNDQHEGIFLADFGIAKALDQSNSLTRTGEFYASLQYAAPEQLDMQVDVDHRADVYALGCTLYHMLTGVLPYPGANSSQLIHGHLNAPVPLPSQQNPALPKGFDNVIATALAKDRNFRFNSCGELAAAAQQALAGESVPAPRTPPVPQAGKRRWKSIAIIAAVGVLTTAGTAAAFIVRERDRTADQHSLEEARETARQAACAYFRTAFTYSPEGLERYERDVLDGATGEWKSEFEGQFPKLRDAIVSAQVRRRVLDAQCTVKSADKNGADIFVLATTADSTRDNPEDLKKTIPTTMAMEYVDGRWLCSDLVK
ncbi:serine/threonine-protein kinase [Nocardia sp. NPDC052566]|uniref:serine/threonine-protein kinase n=1 Tax=Nocardia sp. NPDC052566 TaxID=3364330 RepID=UPI0037C989BC